MPPSSVAARSLALALLGLGAVAAFPAQSQNVTAFDPYNGVGLSGGGTAGGVTAGRVPPAAIYPQPAPPPAAGMAFNPWNPSTVTAGRPVGVPSVMAGSAGGAPAPSYVPYYERGANLPAPPPGPIESRLLAIPEYGSPPGARTRTATRGPMSITAAPPTPTATVTNTTPPPAPPPAAAPAPMPAAPPPSAKAEPKPEPMPAPPPAKPAPPAATASIAPPPPPAPRQPPPATAMATLTFSSQSAEISGESRSELERVAKSLGHVRQIELRAYAGGPDPNDARKVALARALAVRSYLIDLGVKSRIEVGAFAANGKGGPPERVDIVAPGS